LIQLRTLKFIKSATNYVRKYKFDFFDYQKLQGLIVLLTTKNLTTGGKKGMVLVSMDKIFGGSLFLARYRNDCSGIYSQKLCQSLELRRKCNVEELSNCGNRFRIEQKAYFFQNIKSNGLLCRYIIVNRKRLRID
jgi:hypothetical protein